MEEIKCEQVGMLSGGKWDKLHDISRRVYSIDGISPTVHTMGDGQQELKIVEPIAYDEQNGYLRQDGCVGTLTTDGSSPKHNNRIVEPRIAAMRGRNPNNPSDRTAGSPTEQRLEIGSEETSNMLTTVQKDNLVVEPKLVGGIGEHDFGKQNRQGDRVYSTDGVACALTAQPLGNFGENKYENFKLRDELAKIENGIGIRYIVYKTDGKITHFHEERKSNLEKRPIEDLIYDYNVKYVEKGQTAEIVEIEESSFTYYLLQKLEEKETEWHTDINNMVDSLEDVISFLQQLKYV